MKTLSLRRQFSTLPWRHFSLTTKKPPGHSRLPENLPRAVDAAAGALAAPVGQAPTERRQNAMLVCNNVRANPHIRLSTRAFQRSPALSYKV